VDENGPRTRVRADRRDFLEYRTLCPYSGTAIGPRFVTREHADVPPDPPYAATVKCPTDGRLFDVEFLPAA
jgi:hypothetical protein